MVEALTAAGFVEGEPRPTVQPVKFFEKGDKPLEIVTTRQWYIRNGGRDADLRERLVAARRRAPVAPAVHAGALHLLGRGPQRRLAHLAPALLRRAVPGLVPPRRARPAGLRRAAAADRGRSCRSTRAATCPTGFDETPARRARRLHRRPRRHGHLGDLVALAADRRRLGGRRGPLAAALALRPAPAGARDHPHLAVLLGRARAPRGRRRCRGSTRRSAAGSSTPTARR